MYSDDSGSNHGSQLFCVWKRDKSVGSLHTVLHFPFIFKCIKGRFGNSNRISKLLRSTGCIQLLLVL